MGEDKFFEVLRHMVATSDPVKSVPGCKGPA